MRSEVELLWWTSIREGSHLLQLSSIHPSSAFVTMMTLSVELKIATHRKGVICQPAYMYLKFYHDLKWCGMCSKDFSEKK